MNPIARLEELRAARRRFSELPPADKPDKSDNLTPEQASCRESRVCRVGAGLETTQAGDSTPGENLSGLSGLSGGCSSENDVWSRQRWGLTPDAGITPFTFFMPGLRRLDVDLLTAHLKRQPPAVWQWVEAQTARYAATVRHWSPVVCEVAGMVDALLWQWQPVLTRKAGRFDQISEAARKLRDLEDAASYFKQHPKPAFDPAGEQKEPTP